jgi:hypothetical protein
MNARRRSKKVEENKKRAESSFCRKKASSPLFYPLFFTLFFHSQSAEFLHQAFFLFSCVLLTYSTALGVCLAGKSSQQNLVLELG